MTMQQTASSQLQGFGVPGEKWVQGPWLAAPYALVSASAAYNIVGSTFCTFSSQGIAQAGGTGAFAGLLVNPKVYANYGNLTPTLTLPNNMEVELATAGTYIVTVPSGTTVGMWVYYNTTTGAIGTIAAEGTLPASSAWAHAVVYYMTPTAPGLAVIQMGLNVGQP